MIKTEKGFAQLYKIYGRSETDVKEILGDILNKNGNISVYTRNAEQKFMYLQNWLSRMKRQQKTH